MQTFQYAKGDKGDGSFWHLSLLFLNGILSKGAKKNRPLCHLLREWSISQMPPMAKGMLRSWPMSRAIPCSKST